MSRYGAEYVPLDLPHESIQNPHKLPLPFAGATIATGSSMYSEALSKKDQLKLPEFTHGRLALSINDSGDGELLPRLMWFNDSDKDYKFPAVAVLLINATVGETKSARKGFQYCLRIDIKLRPLTDMEDLCTRDLGLEVNVDKVVLGFAEQSDFVKWMAALDWALKAQSIIEKHTALKFGTVPKSTPAPVVDAEVMRRNSVARAEDEMEAEEQALAREQERLLELTREAEAAHARDQEEARRAAILQKLEQEQRDRETQQRATAQLPPKVEEEQKEQQIIHAVQSAGNASNMDEAELALARMEMLYLQQQQPTVSSHRRGSVSVEEWSSEKSKLIAKLMCLKGTEAWKFARDKILKQKWQLPALKTLVAPGKGFISWTGRKPVKYTRATLGPSEPLNLLMCARPSLCSKLVIPHVIFFAAPRLI